jgi:hypothetical protein
MAANKHLDDGLQARAAVGQPGLRAADPRLPRGPRQLGPPDRRHRSDPRRTVTGTNGVETQVTVIGGEPAQRRGGRAPLRRPRLEVVSHRGQPSQAESRPPESGRRQRSASRPGPTPCAGRAPATASSSSPKSVGANGRHTTVPAAQPSQVTCSGDVRASTGFWTITAVA